MALQPDQVGGSILHNDRILQSLLAQFEAGIDRQLQTHPAGSPFRTRLSWSGGVGSIAQLLAEKYRKGGWCRVAIESEGPNDCWLSLEP